MADPVGAEIVVEQDTPFSAPKRSSRVVKPTSQSSMAVSQAKPTVRAQEEPIGRTIRKGAPSLAPGRSQHNRQGRSRSPTKRGQKRANPGSNAVALNEVENEITVNTGSQRPQRIITPSRRALEALDVNSARLRGKDGLSHRELGS
ncbi:hypothetical protein F5883DRAFT_653942 [Diaporthe sp. PMI_573]|nr:hypothetical protein F5883DRAFT_653942 [Diaporthaceae sp. PMI_573]